MVKGIKNPGSKRLKKCKSYYHLVRKLPIEARFNVKVINGEIIFHMANLNVFNEIFDKKYDGMSIDILSRDQFDCENGNNFSNSWAYKGEMLKPFFRNDLKDRLIVDFNNQVMISFGELPEKYDPLQVECNLILIQKKFHCGYYNFSHMEYNQWELLKMGLYRDSLPVTEPEEFKLIKELKFEVPFDKGEFNYAQEHIRPLYDSLNISQYYVKSIDVEAYSSVEGDHEFNNQLQSARARQIVDALQAYQKPQINFLISSLENWEGFYADIKDTKYEYLHDLSKEAIKEALVTLQYEDSMMTILSSERKASIRLTLERKVSLEKDPEGVIELFGQAVNHGNIEKAAYIQDFLYDQIKNNQLPEHYIGKLNLPKLTEYSPLITNSIIFQYERSVGDIYKHIEAFEELLLLMPDNPRIQYNLAALKLNAANKFTFGSVNKTIWELIQNIQWSIEKPLITRLKVNYFILSTEYHLLNRSYRQKNRSLKQIYSAYRDIEMTDQELLYLARFLSLYSQFQWAENMLSERAYDEDVSNSALEYYLRLTIDDSRKITNRNYKNLLEYTAKNRGRLICDLFLPTSQGGYTFQLLFRKQLTELYCEYCQN